MRHAGLHTRENVGMSSVRQVRILSAENLRFPEEGSSSTESRLSEVGTQKDRLSIPLVEYVQAVRLNDRQIRHS